jgi:hypothetical protein
MFCPSCGQEQVTGDTRFCSRCGLLMTGVSEILRNGGVLPQTLTAGGSKKKKFYRKRGFKQGLFIFLLSFLVVPIIAILSIAANVSEPYAVFIAWVLLWGVGFLRMAYSMLFEPDAPDQLSLEEQNQTTSRGYFGKNKSANALPPQQSIPITDYAPPGQGNWRETNDLAPPSVTDGTTKLFNQEE